MVGSRGFLNHNNTFNSVHNPVISHAGTLSQSGNSLSVIIGVMDEECCIICLESFENDLVPAIQ